MKGPFEEISNMPEFSHITFAKVDIDAVESVGAQFNITQIPSFVYFKKGMKAFQKVGGSKNTVISDIRSHLPAPKLPVASPASTSLTTTSKKTRTETIVEEPKTLDNSATTYEKIKKETVVVTHEKKDTESFSDSAEEFFEDVGDRVENWGERVERWGKDMWRSIKRFFKG
jgi:thioredoxin-like negative regulator of GroEL